MAQECALKLKETCAIQAEPFSSAEVRHGPMTIVRDGFPVLALGMLDGGGDDVIADIRRILRARGAAMLIAHAGGEVCLGVAVIGWFASDAASHGAPRDALRVGALGWLMAHGSGIRVAGTTVTVVPLLLTLLAAWSAWRVGHRVGSSISGHGPDADQIADGERDWTVPVGVATFALGYAAVAAVTVSLAGTPGTAPSSARAVGWALVLGLAVGGPAIAIGSGRAAIWAAVLPGNLRATAASCRSVLRAVLLAAFVTLAVAFALDLATAVNVMSGLGLSGGEMTLFAVVSLLVVPNATIFSASYLLGPGFTVGAQTLVSPTAVVTGALPAFPLLAALPDSGPVPAWTVGLVAVPPLAAALGAALAQRRRPTVRWEEGALRGCAGRRPGGGAAGLAGLSGRRCRRARPDAAGRPPDLRPPGARDHRAGHRRSHRRTGHDVVAAADAAPDRLTDPSRVPGVRLVVLVSGSGTNLQALLDACADPAYGAEVVAVGADRDGIEGLTRAERAGVPTFVHRVGDHATREDWDAALAATLAEHAPDLVVSAGFMKLVGADVLARFPMVNTHPALCPAFPGMHGAADALEYGVTVTGATLFVVDAGVDTGPIVAQVAVPVEDADDVDSLHDRIKVAERRMLVDAVGRMAREGWSVDGRRVRIG